jgi:hypothetical protein
MEKESRKASEEALLKVLDTQWQDHFQTRSQTWKALEVTALLAVALVGLDWQIGVKSRWVTIVAAGLLALMALFGMQITLRHRNEVEITKFKRITAIENELEVGDPSLKLPQPMHWWHVFLIRKSHTALFILRMQFAIFLFGVAYLVMRLLGLW